jgi:tetratricopeptide (TPR) repeat protein/serine phosphatase RsbU (regulator of sigma subunit)
VFIVLLTLSNLQAQTKVKSKTDSLLNLLSKSEQDTNRILLLNELRRAYSSFLPSKSFEYGKEALELSQKLNYTKGLANSYGGLGSFYRQQGDYGKATEYQLNALKYYEKLSKYNGIATANNNLGVLYYRQGNWQEAMKYYQKALYLAKKQQKEEDIATYILNIGEVHQELQQYDSAIFYERKVIEISERLNIQDNIAYAIGIIGQVYMAQKKYTEALQNELKALKIFEIIDDKDAIAEYQADIAMAYLAIKNYALAKQYAEKCLATAQKNESKQWQKEAYLALSKIAEQEKQFEQAHNYFKNYSILKDFIFNENSIQKIQQVQIIYETEKKQGEIDLLKKSQQVQQEQIKQQSLLLYLGGAIGLLIIIFAFILYRNNIQKQRTNILLQAQKQAIQVQNTDLQDKSNIILLKNIELEQQQEEILAQAENLMYAHKEITVQKNILETQNTQIKKKSDNIESSIRYAQRIQKAFLPSHEALSKTFSKYFVFYKPKDIVSGDFYWLHQEKDIIIVAVVDCTGHGVPGALMSMMGNSLLNQTISDKKIVKPHLILDELHNGIRKALHQTNTENRDGMDIALLTVTKEDSHILIEYAGANNSLIFIKNNELQEIKPDKMSIGGYQQEYERHFTLQQFRITNNDVINYSFYLFSDGYQDQFGGENIRKIGKANFRRLLNEVNYLEMEKQGEVLETYFEQWQHTQDQIDDVLVMGFVL